MALFPLRKLPIELVFLRLALINRAAGEDDDFAVDADLDAGHTDAGCQNRPNGAGNVTLSEGGSLLHW